MFYLRLEHPAALPPLSPFVLSSFPPKWKVLTSEGTAIQHPHFTAEKDREVQKVLIKAQSPRWLTPNPKLNTGLYVGFVLTINKFCLIDVTEIIDPCKCFILV